MTPRHHEQVTRSVDQRSPGPTTAPIVRVTTRTSELLGRLREDLLSGELPAGGPLRMNALREHYCAGITPLREALFQLVAEGLVAVEDQRGFRAADVSWDDLADLTEQRVFLESQALRLAIEHGDLGWESRVLAVHHRLAGTIMLSDDGDLTEDWVQTHREFHRVLVETCGSPRLLRFREQLSDQAERYRRWSVRQEPSRDVAAEHRALAEAAVARRSDLAVQCLADHYWRTARLCHLGDGNSAVGPQGQGSRARLRS